MCLEHLDHALIHRLQQRLGDRRQEDELDVPMQILKHIGVGGSIIQGHQDTEGEALRRAILLQLVHQGHPAIVLENVARHPTTGTGEPMDRQARLCIALECTKVLGVIHNDGLQLAVCCQVSPQQEGETVLKWLEAPGRLLLPHDVLQSRIFFQCRPVPSTLNTCWGLYPPSSMMALRRSG